MDDRAPKIMYRQPGVSNHQSVDVVLDEIIYALRDVIDRLNKLEGLQSQQDTDGKDLQ